MYSRYNSRFNLGKTPTRRVFYSFDYDQDIWRAAQIRNIRTVDGERLAFDNGWESVRRASETAIKSWINKEMERRTCTVVLIGRETAFSKWVQYEIRKSWDDRMGLLGIHIHNLKDSRGATSRKGINPFHKFKLRDGRYLSSIVRVYDLPVTLRTSAYHWISENMNAMIEEGIAIRRNA